MNEVSSDPSRARPDATALGHSMHRLLKCPLSALRASIESLAAELGSDDPHGRLLEGALSQVTRLARDVQALVDYATPRPVAPLACSLDEIARCALRMLPHESRGRVDYAHPKTRSWLEVDGPLLTQCLEHLLQAALEAGPGPLLLQARREPQRALFVLVREDRAGSFEPQTADLDAAGGTSRDVGLALARRDIARLGGALHVLHTARGVTCVTVEVPLEPAARRGRAA